MAIVIPTLISFKNHTFGNITNVPNGFYVGIFVTTGIAIALQLAMAIAGGVVAEKGSDTIKKEYLDHEIIKAEWPEFLHKQCPLLNGRKVVHGIVMLPTIFVGLCVIPEIFSPLGKILMEKAMQSTNEGLAKFCNYISGELTLVFTFMAFRILQTACQVSTLYLKNKDVEHRFMAQDGDKTTEKKYVNWFNILIGTALLRSIVIPVGFSLINRSIQYSIKAAIEAIVKETLSSNATLAINIIVAPLVKGLENMLSGFVKDMMPIITDEGHEAAELMEKAKANLGSNFLEGVFGKLISILVVDIALTAATKSMEKYAAWLVTNVVSSVIEYAAVEGLISHAIIYGFEKLGEKIKSSKAVV